MVIAAREGTGTLSPLPDAISGGRRLIFPAEAAERVLFVISLQTLRGKILQPLLALLFRQPDTAINCLENLPWRRRLCEILVSPRQHACRLIVVLHQRRQQHERNRGGFRVEIG